MGRRVWWNDRDPLERAPRPRHQEGVGRAWRTLGSPNDVHATTNGGPQLPVLLQALDITVALVIRVGAKTRRLEPTRRSNLTSRPEVRDALLKDQRGRCIYCSTRISVRRDNYEVDHKTPLARQGKDAVANLQALCRACNKQKGARTHAEYQHLLRHGRERPSYMAFRRKSRYLTPRESFTRLGPMVVGVSVVGGLVLGALAVEQPLLGALILGLLTAAWMVGAFYRGVRTGAL